MVPANIPTLVDQGSDITLVCRIDEFLDTSDFKCTWYVGDNLTCGNLTTIRDRQPIQNKCSPKLLATAYFLRGSEERGSPENTYCKLKITDVQFNDTVSYRCNLNFNYGEFRRSFTFSVAPGDSSLHVVQNRAIIGMFISVGLLAGAVAMVTVILVSTRRKNRLQLLSEMNQGKTDIQHFLLQDESWLYRGSAPSLESGFYRRSVLSPDHTPLLNHSEYSKLEEYEDFLKHLESEIHSEHWTPMTFSALSDISQIFGIVITPGSLSLSSLTTKHLKDAMETDGRLHQASDSALVEPFKEALDNLEFKRFDLALEKFKIVVNYVQHSSNEEIRWQIHASKVLIFSQLMIQMYEKEQDTFLPFEILDDKRKNLCQLSITERCDKLSAMITTMNEDENTLDPLHRAVYPILSVCSSFTRPRKYLTNLPIITIQPKYIPLDEFEATPLPMGLIGEKEQIAFVWRRVGSKDKEFNVRVGSRVFTVPSANMDEVKIQCRFNPTKSPLFTCISWNRDGDKIYCIYETGLPKGIRPVLELMKELKKNPAYASNEPYLRFSRLGPIYLKELTELDFNQTNDKGDTLLYLVAYQGRLDLLRYLLDAGVDMNGGEEPTFLRIAGEGNPVKHREILKEFIVRHTYAGTQDIENHEGQTALHKAVLSKNKDFVMELIQGKPYLII